jgi:5-formyltetrahydrofolate cyclo-ligase
MNKSTLRQIYKEKRLKFSSEEIKNSSKKISEKLFNEFSFQNKTVHTFLSIERLNEINTLFINQNLFNSNCTVVTSITNYTHPISLTHSIIYEKSEFEVDEFNIPIPKDKIAIDLNKIDIVLIPLLAFDQFGNRLGYGKGLYDSFLKDCSSNCIKIGVSFFEAHHETIPTENHDVKLDYCITPHKLYKFNNGV